MPNAVNITPKITGIPDASRVAPKVGKAGSLPDNLGLIKAAIANPKKSNVVIMPLVKNGHC